MEAVGVWQHVCVVYFSIIVRGGEEITFWNAKNRHCSGYIIGPESVLLMCCPYWL
jgi:hypothetical protein